MAFWINPNPEPKRAHRWYIEFGGANLKKLVYALKKTDKPAATISSIEHKYLNHSFYYPGRLTWNEISITFASVTDPDAARILYKILQESGYGPPATALSSTERSTISKGKANAAIGQSLDIVQIDSSGTPIEKFKLFNPFFTEVTFGGTLDYEQEGIVDLTCKVKYDYAELDAATKVQGVAARDATATRPQGVRNLTNVGDTET